MSKSNLSSKSQVNTCLTPKRVKALDTKTSEPTITCTPKRVHVSSSTPCQRTPKTVARSRMTIECNTPNFKSFQPLIVLKTPCREFQERDNKLQGVGTPERVPKPLSNITPKRVPVSFSARTPEPCPVMKVEADSPGLKGNRAPSQLTESTPIKGNDTKKQADGIDLRTIWKTKKTPSKSPIMKEVMSEEASNVVTPTSTNIADTKCAVLTSIRRKKTITWAAEDNTANTILDEVYNVNL
ncbi:hypothetical protein ACF0H5_017974 [Mactra antiquata]